MLIVCWGEGGGWVDKEIICLRQKLGDKEVDNPLRKLYQQCIRKEALSLSVSLTDFRALYLT